MIIIKIKRNVSTLLAATVIVASSCNSITVFANEVDEIYDFDGYVEDYQLSENFEVEDFSEEVVTSKARTVNVIDAKKYGNLKGNGTDETNQIQSMLNKIKSEYAGQKVTIKFPAGKYYAKGSIVVYSNMTIEGEPNKTIFRNTSRGPFFLNGIKNKQYKGNAGSNITIRNIIFDKSRAISVGQGKNIVIENIRVIDMPNCHAIEIAACNNVVVRNSVFEGMNENDTSEFSRGRDFNEFIQLDRMASGSFPYFGTYNDSKYQAANKNVTIENCTFKKSNNHSYFVAIGTHGSFKNDKVVTDGLKIKNCKFYDAKNAAISFPGVNNLSIENSTFKNAKVGIRYQSEMKNITLNKMVINNNTFSNVPNGIEIQQYKGTKPIKELTITNNTFSNDKEGNIGISIKGTSNITYNISKNKVSNYKKATYVEKDHKAAPVPKSAKAIVVDTKVNVRSNVHAADSSFATLTKGTQIVARDTLSNAWKAITVNGKTGYIQTKSISYNIPTNNTTTTTTTTTKKTGTIKSDGIRVRKSQSTSSTILTHLYKGNKVTIEAKYSNGWAKINTGKYTGYIYSCHINEGQSSSQTTTTSKKTGTIKSDGIRVRKSQSTSSAILTHLYKGNKVTIEAKYSNGWAKINTGKYTGYIYYCHIQE